MGGGVRRKERMSGGMDRKNRRGGGWMAACGGEALRMERAEAE